VELTCGNVLYLRHGRAGGADGRLEKQHGYWQWVGDPSVPCGLVELIESRIGALPAAVGAVIDALAIGEPIDWHAGRITDPDAVEEADTRGQSPSTTSTRRRSACGTRSTAGPQEARRPKARRLRGWSPLNWALRMTATTPRS
jgi:hypothetical protein